MIFLVLIIVSLFNDVYVLSVPQPYVIHFILLWYDIDYLC